MNYKLKEAGVLWFQDGAFVPNDSANHDWQEYQKWLDKGNVPLPADLSPASFTAAEQAEAEILRNPAILGFVRTVAEARGVTEQQMIDAIKAKL